MLWGFVAFKLEIVVLSKTYLHVRKPKIIGQGLVHKAKIIKLQVAVIKKVIILPFLILITFCSTVSMRVTLVAIVCPLNIIIVNSVPSYRSPLLGVFVNHF